LNPKFILKKEIGGRMKVLITNALQLNVIENKIIPRK
jgi:hypothetical protein